MSSLIRHKSNFILVALIGWLAVGCTNGIRPKPEPVRLNSNTIPREETRLQDAAELRFDDADTEVLHMVAQGNSMFITGRPFMFSRWEIGQNPESPQVTFAASDNIPYFTGGRPWPVDWFASGSIGLIGNWAILSGTVGASVISLAETTRPKEIQRYPAHDPNASGPTADDAFVWAAMVTAGRYAYAFREQDYVYTIDTGAGRLDLVRREAYVAGGQNTCCVNSAVLFNETIYVAFRNRMLMLDIAPNGALTNPREYRDLHVFNVAASQRYLYVQHEPAYGQQGGDRLPRGIYVFDASGNNVARFGPGTTSPLQFIVSPNDSHFLANRDNKSIQVSRILWTNR